MGSLWLLPVVIAIVGGVVVVEGGLVVGSVVVIVVEGEVYSANETKMWHINHHVDVDRHARTGGHLWGASTLQFRIVIILIYHFYGNLT